LNEQTDDGEKENCSRLVDAVRLGRFSDVDERNEETDACEEVSEERDDKHEFFEQVESTRRHHGRASRPRVEAEEFLDVMDRVGST